jgi:hypothetical protein
MKIPLAKVNAGEDASIALRIVRTMTERRPSTSLVARHRDGTKPQCEIIHGRLPGKLLAPFLPRLVRRMDLPVQQVQPAP